MLFNFRCHHVPNFFTFRVAIDVVFGHGTTAVFPAFQLGTHFSQLHPLYFIQPAWKRSSEKERMKTRSNEYSTQ